MAYNDISILSERYVFDIILRLYNKTSCICRDLSDIISSPRTLKQMICALESNGLISKTIESRPRRSYVLSLTPLGK